MCRMLAARAEDGTFLHDVLLNFRKQARRAAAGPPQERSHRDGWGLVACDAGGFQGWFRQPEDASTDPDFARAARENVAGLRDAMVMVHFRNASVGARVPENTHPFFADGWAFAHNGTIHGGPLLDLPGIRYEGTTDSERYFRRLLAGIKSGYAPEEALRRTVKWMDAYTTYSSLTCLFTDGKSLYGYRRLGPDRSDCGTAECQADYYRLGFGKLGRVTLVAQETTHLGPVHGWTDVPDDGMLVWRPDEAPRIVPLNARGLAAPAQSMSRSR